MFKTKPKLREGNPKLLKLLREAGLRREVELPKGTVVDPYRGAVYVPRLSERLQKAQREIQALAQALGLPVEQVEYQIRRLLSVEHGFAVTTWRDRYGKLVALGFMENDLANDGERDFLDVYLRSATNPTTLWMRLANDTIVQADRPKDILGEPPKDTVSGGSLNGYAPQALATNTTDFPTLNTDANTNWYVEAKDTIFTGQTGTNGFGPIDSIFLSKGEWDYTFNVTVATGDTFAVGDQVEGATSLAKATIRTITTGGGTQGANVWEMDWDSGVFQLGETLQKVADTTQTATLDSITEIELVAFGKNLASDGVTQRQIPQIDGGETFTVSSFRITLRGAAS